MRINDAGTVEDAVSMAERFYRHHGPKWHWNKQATRHFLSGVAETGFLAVTDGGFIAGLITPHPISPEWLIASELLWWAEDNSGLALMRAFRRWAKASGANEIVYSAPAHAVRARQVMARFGKPSEIYYSEAV